MQESQAIDYKQLLADISAGRVYPGQAHTIVHAVYHDGMSWESIEVDPKELLTTFTAAWLRYCSADTEAGLSRFNKWVLDDFTQQWRTAVSGETASVVELRFSLAG